MGFWTNDLDRHSADEVEDLAYGATGGPAKQWLAGALVPVAICIYGMVCLDRGYTTLPGSGGQSMALHGAEGVALACSYLAFGAFLHFHYFWGLHDKLYRFSQGLKVTALLLALPLFLYALGKTIFWA